jgi:hypothetical protein
MIIKAWEHYFNEMRFEMKVCYSHLIIYILLTFWQNAAGKVSLTGDTWDDKSMRAYFGVTAHYLVHVNSSVGTNGVFILRASLIRFLPVPGKHHAQDIARALLFVTDCAEITDKVCLFY